VDEILSSATDINHVRYHQKHLHVNCRCTISNSDALLLLNAIKELEPNWRQLRVILVLPVKAVADSRRW
jgi:hypothetical protein